MGHPSKFQWVSRLGFVTAATSVNGSQPNFARCSAVSWACTLYIHFRGLLPRDGIYPGAKLILCPSLALSYIVSVSARHRSSEREPNFAALSRGRHLYSAGWPSCWALAHILVHCSFWESFVSKCVKRTISKCKFLYNVIMRFKLYHITHSHINE